jgi:hypothetical protein
MRPREEEPSNAVGHDSFLDVVTNMVGILIILVMVVGMRIKNAPVQAAPDSAAVAAAESFTQDARQEASIRGDLAASGRQIDTIRREAMLRRRQRDLLAGVVTATELEIRARRDELDESAKADFDLNRQREEARKTLEQLEATRRDAEKTTESRPTVIESLPTPVSKKVFGEETHFQLRQGRIVHVPIDKLVELARSDAIHKADKLFGEKGMPQFTETVGPIDGFRFRYMVERREWSEKTPQGVARHVGFQMLQWTAVPTDSRLGEPIEAALADNSRFRNVVDKLRPEQTTVTVWVYDDSFATFREFRKEFYRLGFPVAARPLPAGTMIAGSPKGTRSEAE